MGVMACDRRGCSNIMCNHYSSEYGYICNDCLGELMNKAGSVTIDIFMSTEKSGVEDYIRDAHLKHIEETFAQI